MKNMKHCPRCNKSKMISEFNRHLGRADKLQAYCRECQQKGDKTYYDENRNGRKQKIRKTEKLRKYRNWQFIAEYLKKNPCVDCGESEILVLEFDHIRGDKKFGIGDRPTRGVSLKKLKEEIAKCEIRCGNCHKRKTAVERKYWILEYI